MSTKDALEELKEMGYSNVCTCFTQSSKSLYRCSLLQDKVRSSSSSSSFASSSSFSIPTFLFNRILHSTVVSAPPYLCYFIVVPSSSHLQTFQLALWVGNEFAGLSDVAISAADVEVTRIFALLPPALSYSILLPPDPLPIPSFSPAPSIPLPASSHSFSFLLLISS